MSCDYDGLFGNLRGAVGVAVEGKVGDGTNAEARKADCCVNLAE
jgi:hypothetical protein